MIFALLAMPVYAKKAPAPDPRVLDSVEVSVTPATNFVTDLIACQDLDVGDLFINASIEENSYEVRYLITEPGWYLKEIHFEAINEGDENYIYSSGGLIPGKFTEKVYFDLPTIDEMTGVVIGGIREYSFLYNSGAEVTDFAAHAVVCEANITEEVINEMTGTTLIEGYIASGESTPGATLVREPFGYPNEPDDPNYTSVWETEFNKSPDFAAKVLASGADFIWSHEYSTRTDGAVPSPTSNYWTVYGDVFKVDVPVAVPDDADNINASLYIVADNGYIAKTGDDIISYAGFNPTAYAALTPETEVATEPEALLLEVYATLRPSDTITGAAFFVDSVVPSSAWKSMIAVENPFTLTNGLNTVNIATVNEQMNGGTYSNNPAGVIFFIEYSWEVPLWEDVTHYYINFDNCETVWGEGTPVNDGNQGDWSMTIPNEGIPGPVIPEIVASMAFDEGTIILSDTQVAGSWYTDRRNPAGFASEMFDGDYRLKHSIDEADATDGFYGTQGRKYDIETTTKMSIDLYIPAAWETTNSRMAGFWATAFDAADTISLYPIIEFTSDSSNPRFRVYDNGLWIDLGVTISYDSWYTLTMELTADEVIYTVNGVTQAIDNLDSIQFGNVILQGHNYLPGTTYDIYWDNFLATK